MFALAEFASFAVPLINVQKAKNVFKRLFSSSSTTQSIKQSSRTDQDCEKCAICEQRPTNVREIGCAHVFCFYCATTSLTADPTNGLLCPKCSFVVKETNEIIPVRICAN